MQKKLFVLPVLLLMQMLFGSEAENLLIPGQNRTPVIRTHGKAEYRFEKNGLAFRLDGPLAVATVKFPAEPESRHLSISGKAACRELKPGKESWQRGQLSLIFFDRAGQRMKKGINAIRLDGTREAKTFQISCALPDGTSAVQLDGANYGQSGFVEFSEMKLFFSREKVLFDAEVPDGSTQERLWSLSDAYRTGNSMRETVCLNGLWQFLPVREKNAEKVPPPQSGWAYFKVPGVIPDNSWLTGSAQTIYYHPLRTGRIPEPEINRAWYRRTIAVPREWKGRRLILEFTGLQSTAEVLVNGRKAGTSRYPGTPMELTDFLRPGETCELALLVSATRPEVFSKVYMAGDRAVKAFEMRNRGITGDLFLSAIPKGTNFSDVRIETSVRNRRIVFDCGFERAHPGRHRLVAEIRENGKTVKTFHSPEFELPAGRSRFSFGGTWSDPKLWDTDHPEHLYTATVTLSRTDSSRPADQFGPEEFGFREFRIEGRNFLLNETPIHLRMLAADILNYSPDATNNRQCEAMCRRLKELNVNAVISGAYNCDPGTIGYLDSMHRITSKHGILSTFTMPHAKNYPDLLTNPATAERYRAEAEWFLRRFQNLPGIIMYAMNHNLTGYYGDQNPQKIDGIHSQDIYEKQEPRRRASATWDIVRRLDPSRPVYHHESGSLDGIYTLNCYLNWAPMQEKSDWFEHWESKGRIPLMLMEWGIPHAASFSSHRGAPFIHRAAVNQWINLLEWGAPFFGESIYESTPQLENYYREERTLLRGNTKLHLWQLQKVWDATEIPQKIWAVQLPENLFALRRRGVSAILPWDQNRLLKRTKKFQAKENPDRFRDLKKPGTNPDHFNSWRHMRYNWMTAYDHEHFELTPAGRAVAAGFAEVTGRITGPRHEFSEKGHNYRPGETVRKQLTILNDSRRSRKIEWQWNATGLNRSETGSTVIPPGQYAEIPLTLRIPFGFTGKTVLIQADFRCTGFPDVSDRFRIDVIPPETATEQMNGIGLYDPEGSAAELMRSLNLPYRKVTGNSGLAGLRLLICGRNSLEKPLPGLAETMKNGTALLVLEQSYATLYRLGFRAQIHGLRQLWTLAGPFRAEREIHDWRGKSTLLPEYLPGLPQVESNDVRQNWGHLKNTRVWRAGNRGMVAGVIPEKPSRGDFLPLIQGGFNLEYAPLLEYRGKDGRALFCQLDVSGRTETDPEALEILRECIRHGLRKKENAFRPLYAVGSPQLWELLTALSIPAQPLAEHAVPPENALIVFDSSGAETVRKHKFGDGTNLLALNLTAEQVASFVPGKFRMETGKHGFSRANGLRDVPVFEGISNADLHFRTTPEFASFEKHGPGGRLLRTAPYGTGRIVFCQLAPWNFNAAQNDERCAIRRSQYLTARLLYNLGAASSVEMAPYLEGTRRNSDGKYYFPALWKGLEDPDDKGRSLGWQKASHDFGHWRTVTVPGYFNQQFKELGGYNGLFWYKLRFDMPDPADCELYIGPVDDESFCWLNDRYLGEVTTKTHPQNYWEVPRAYPLKAAELKKQGNVLTILCRGLRGNNGIPWRPSLKREKPSKLLYADEPVPGDDPYRYYRW